MTETKRREHIKIEREYSQLVVGLVEPLRELLDGARLIRWKCFLSSWDDEKLLFWIPSNRVGPRNFRVISIVAIGC